MRAEDKMRVIGITGGVGCGKSRILQYLSEAYGAVVCQLDETAKKLQQKGQPCYDKIVEVFGGEIVGADSELDRPKLAGIVFADRERLAVLNGIVHPAVKERTLQDIERERERGTALFVIESAILPDAGYEDICGEMWYIYTQEDVRRERLKDTRGYSDRQISQMMASQPAESRFRETCSAVIDNSGSFENTKRQIGELLR